LRPTNAEVTAGTHLSWNANVHGFFDDNTVLRDTGFGGGLHLRPKGLDIALNTAPEGPYDNSMANVPYRQLCFGPDWFSTELTTSTTTFVFIVNAQIVETRTAGTANPNLLYSCQWGACVEIAPDITMDIPQATNLNYYANGVNGPVGVTGIGSPGYYKTQKIPSFDSMDKYVMPDGVTPNPNGIVNQYNKYKYTYATTWEADMRGIPPVITAKTGFNTGAFNAASFYGGPDQTRKRVVVRALWSLTDNANR
jgi:hypothetical protein